MAPILVTGAAGNVGREIVRSLLARDIPVIATDYDEARSVLCSVVRARSADHAEPWAKPA